MKDIGIDEGYKLIPMNEITDEARKIAVRWMGCEDKNLIGQKHKLASDIMNYARKQVEAALPVILNEAAEKAMVHVISSAHDIDKDEKQYINQDYGTEVFVSKRSILSLTESSSLKQKLGL